MNRTLLTACALVALSLAVQAGAQRKAEQGPKALPVIPVGLDAYRMWDRLPEQRFGVRAYMRSTYDREGGNQSADASHYLFANEEDYNVSLDVKGRGVFYFFRANHWHGSPWHFVVDGTDNVVSETGTADPIHAKRDIERSEFIPAAAFPRPLCWTWADTKGADLIWTPMPFEESMRVAYSRTRYGTGYYIYHLFADGAPLSQPVSAWSLGQTPDADVVELVGRAGQDIAPKNIAKKAGTVRLDKERVTLAEISAKPSAVRALRLTIPLYRATALERLRLVATWDGAAHPSIDAPLCLFFGAGTLYNRTEREFLVEGFPINIRFDYPNNKVELSCYYPMPFFRSARFELAGIDPAAGDEVGYEIRYEPWQTAPELSSYFHATYTDIPDPELGHDMVYLDTKGIEGHEHWSGSFVGTSFIFSHNGFLGTLEGDPRFYFDGSRTPQAYGTGTEEWGGGGDYWGGQNMTLPFAGHPCGAPGRDKAKHEKDLIESGYRFLLADMMPFGNRAVIRFEHGGENLTKEHYEAVAYWYGLPAPSLVLTDRFDVGNTASEQAHGYVSPDASEVVTLTSRYEQGIDLFPYYPWFLDRNGIPGYDKLAGTEVYPAETRDGRTTRGVSQFAVALDPANRGALIRRTLDYSFPNQTAEVWVADPATPDDWQRAGVWYLAGSNTCIYSDPAGELEPRLLRTKTSNRRLRDDEFMIPEALTRGKDKVLVRLQFVPDGQQLFPEFPFPKESAWSELDYEVYSYVIPDFQVK